MLVFGPLIFSRQLDQDNDYDDETVARGKRRRRHYVAWYLELSINSNFNRKWHGDN